MLNGFQNMKVQDNRRIRELRSEHTKHVCTAQCTQLKFSPSFLFCIYKNVNDYIYLQFVSSKDCLNSNFACELFVFYKEDFFLNTVFM